MWRRKIAAMLKKYRQESMDIDDVDYEEVDLEEEELFNPKPLHEE